MSSVNKTSSIVIRKKNSSCELCDWKKSAQSSNTVLNCNLLFFYDVDKIVNICHTLKIKYKMVLTLVLVNRDAARVRLVC